MVHEPESCPSASSAAIRKYLRATCSAVLDPFVLGSSSQQPIEPDPSMQGKNYDRGLCAYGVVGRFTRPVPEPNASKRSVFSPNNQTAAK
jgi:hypothetical protein